MKKLTHFLILALIPCSGISQDLRIFNLTPVDYASAGKGAFISLTDESIWTEGNIEMADEYEQERITTEDHHTLTEDRRSDFLKAVQVNESDRIFVYCMFLDTVFIYPVKELPLIEKPNAYTGTETGFKITNIDLNSMGEYYWNTFVYIGKSNPFQTGNIRPIRWKQADSTIFPADIKSRNHVDWIDSFTKDKVFEFTTDSLTYLIQNLISEGGAVQARHLIVIEEKTDSIVFNHTYLDAESTGLSPLITENENIQWTGKIFKNKPSIVYGFEWITFGCPSIDFIGYGEPSIRILCDNRH